AFALRRSRKIVRGLKEGLTEDERYAVADHAVAQLKEGGDPWRLNEEAPAAKPPSTPVIFILFCDQSSEIGFQLPAKLRAVGSAETIEMRPVASKGRKANVDYRVREHPTEAEVDKLLAALKRNRHGHRDWLIGLLIYRHGLRVSEACDLRW